MQKLEKILKIDIKKRNFKISRVQIMSEKPISKGDLKVFFNGQNVKSAFYHKKGDEVMQLV